MWGTMLQGHRELSILPCTWGMVSWRSLLSPPLRRFQMRLSPDVTLVARADFTEESMPNLRKGEQLQLEVDMEELVSRLNELDAKIRHIQERL